MSTYVNCLKCGEHHSTKEVEFLNIEEDIQGRDLMTFMCPVVEEETKSLVFGS
jgi:hypothetical protein